MRPEKCRWKWQDVSRTLFKIRVQSNGVLMMVETIQMCCHYYFTLEQNRTNYEPIVALIPYAMKQCLTVKGSFVRRLICCLKLTKPNPPVHLAALRKQTNPNDSRNVTS